MNDRDLLNRGMCCVEITTEEIRQKGSITAIDDAVAVFRSRLITMHAAHSTLGQPCRFLLMGEALQAKAPATGVGLGGVSDSVETGPGALTDSAGRPVTTRGNQ